MRISDWSSDVCSSDLELHDIDPRPENRMDQKGVATKSISRIVDADMLDEVPKVDKVSMEKARWLRRQELPQERKRVVLGKSVSVRVDIGGGRIIKKKIRIKNRATSTR